MLESLLSALAAGGLHTPRQLARRLGVTEGLVEQMLADLTRMGYLRSVASPGCHMASEPVATSAQGRADCPGCPLGGACAVTTPGGQMWALTEKAFESWRALRVSQRLS